MRWTASIVVLASAIAIVIVMLNPAVSAGLSRSDGDFWKYSMSMEFAGVPVSGTLTYSYDGEAALTVNGTEHTLDVMSLSGNFSYVDDGYIPIRIAGLVSGYAYETKGDTGLVMETVNILATRYSGTPPAQFETPLSLSVRSSFESPLYEGLSSEELRAGDTWSVSTSVCVATNWTEGAEADGSVLEAVTVYEYSVDSVGESLSTPAGTFTTAVVTVSHPGGSDVLWMSDEVGGLVQRESFNGTDEAPIETLVLESYSYEGEEDQIVLIIAVLLVVATAFIMVLLLMAILRSGRSHGAARDGSESQSADARFNPTDDDEASWSRGGKR